MYKCYECKKVKPSDAFYPDESRYNGLQSKCKECRRVDKYSNFRTKTSKVCSGCKIDKPVSEFYKKNSGDGYQGYCKQCSLAKKKRWDSKKSDERRLERVERKYGLKASDYENLLESQGGVCAICKREVELVVDHCHDSNEVRGLLCQQCNSGIGFLQDDLETVKSAVTYLSRE